MIKVIRVSTKKELKQFALLPHKLYRGDVNWIPPLTADILDQFNPKKNPYFDHSEVQPFLAVKNGKIVGRVTAHTNTEYNKFHNESIGFFGFYESINDQEVTNSLMDAVEVWLKDKGCDTSRGPMNFSTNDEVGFLLEGYNTPPYVMMTHTKEYYHELFAAHQYKKSMDLLAYQVEVCKPPERLTKLTEKLEKRGNFTIRCLSKNKKQRRKDIETVFRIYTKAWERNWGYVPMTPKEFDHIVDAILPIAMPDFVFIAEVDGEPAGFSLTLPDYNFVLKKMNGKINPLTIAKALYYKNKIPRLRVITMGVIKEFQSRGIDTVFYQKSYQKAYDYFPRFKTAEFSWVLETNTMMNRVAKSIGGKVHKRYRIYDKKID